MYWFWLLTGMKCVFEELVNMQKDRRIVILTASSFFLPRQAGFLFIRYSAEGADYQSQCSCMPTDLMGWESVGQFVMCIHGHANRSPQRRSREDMTVFSASAGLKRETEREKERHVCSGHSLSLCPTLSRCPNMAEWHTVSVVHITFTRSGWPFYLEVIEGKWCMNGATYLTITFCV